ncbi:DUF2812 domain-containing protein [Bacillus sp. MRMR6]|uniref:DUF2812 domain-containing protein n=1 Tax=Bacillus sp. MRMR6 TaxID=1928617 RepID=UPI000952705F|nr:DUF2812 domain-containing protein [Bacillus sp. MRMR6]OLS33360.1 hypothetical protein BTR25_26375 [Bacillus sp. MRMR6]
MSKAAYKLRPSDYWRIGEHENWFQEMAAKGYHLKKMGIYFAKFVKDEPKEMRYRIEVSIKKKMTREQIHMYAENGWDYVTRYNYFHVFSSLSSSGAPELHTDPAEQSFTLKELDKKLAWNAGLGTVMLIILIGMLASIWFLDRTPTLVLVEGMAIQLTVFTFFLIFSAYTSIQAARSIRALRKNLIEGKPIDHHAPWKKHSQLNSIILFLFTVMVGLSAILPFLQLVKAETKTLPESSPDLPIVRLADIENHPALVRGEPYNMGDHVDWGNRYTLYWSLLAPVQYETNENGVVSGEMWEDNGGEYSPSIQTKVYQLSLPGMADHLIFDLIERYKYEYSDEDYVEIKNPNFNLLIVHEEKEFKEVYSSKGKAVIHVRYFGHADINSVIENIEEKIKLISE